MASSFKDVSYSAPNEAPRLPGSTGKTRRPLSQIDADTLRECEGLTISEIARKIRGIPQYARYTYSTIRREIMRNDVSTERGKPGRKKKDRFGLL